MKIRVSTYINFIIFSSCTTTDHFIPSRGINGLLPISFFQKGISVKQVLLSSYCVLSTVEGTKSDSKKE